MESPSPRHLLHQAIAAARQGDRRRARMFLAKVTELAPEEPLGWLWRAGLAEGPEQALVWINRTLDLEPDHPQARRALSHVRLQAAMAVAWSGDVITARELFRRAAADDPRSIIPWLELAAMAESPDESRQCLAEVLSREPGHSGALKCLAQLNAEHLVAAKQTTVAAAPPRRDRSERDELVAVEFELPPEFEEMPQQPSSPPREKRAVVLVVDDTQSVRDLIKRHLEDMGLQAFEARGADDAVAILRTHGVPDLILLDGVMPRVNGFELCHQLRQKKETATVPIVLLAFLNGWLPPLRSMISGFTDTLAKPIAPAALRTMVAKYCPVRAEEYLMPASWPELPEEVLR